MGATVNINLTVGSHARVGNSATVKADVPANGRVYAGTIWPPRGL
jgi:acetyltransferase-like isoleucine patch superfamily enzyme